MKSDNVIQQKSYQFAIRVVNLYKYLVEQKREFVLSKQVVRSGTSIGANIEEAIGGQSKPDFIAKCSTAYKEARETHFWLRLLRDTAYIDHHQAASLLADLDEILRILASILKTSKEQ